MIGDGDCGTIGGMKIGRGNRCTRRKPADRNVRNWSWEVDCIVSRGKEIEQGLYYVWSKF
jgi:hypothetical protein